MDARDKTDGETDHERSTKTSLDETVSFGTIIKSVMLLCKII